MSDEKKVFKRKLEGVVVSDKNTQTIVVNVQRRFKDRRYNKFVYKNKKYHVHDVKDQAKVGDVVSIIESRSYSAKKKWELTEIKKPAIQV